MADHLVTLSVSDHIYEQARRIAEATTQPIEQVLQKQFEVAVRLPMLPPDEEAELAALKLLSDDALWTIAAEQMPQAQQERQSQLLELNGRGVISDTDLAELNDSLHRGDQLMVRKAEAAGILTERGHKVTRKDLAAPSK